MKKCSSNFLAAVLVVMLAICSPVWADVAIDEANFPDEVFREYVSGLDKNNDGSLSDSEIAAVTVIDVHKKEYYYYYDFEESEDKISSLKGIEYFTSLESLDCSCNLITALDLSKNTALVRLNCSSNYVEDYTHLKSRRIYYLESLNVTGCRNLQELYCEFNGLKTLDVSSNTALKKLNCEINNLRTLDITNNQALTELNCQGNSLTTLDLSKNTALMELACGYNNLIALDVSKNTNLTMLACWSN